MLEASGTSIVYDLNFEPEMRELRAQIARWIEQSDAEMHEALKWQFVAGSKYFRPLTIFSCYRAMHQGEVPAQIIRGALLIELFHNVSLVIDDIVDQSEYRREQLTLHTKFGQLTALMTSGYIVADGYRVAGDDLQASNLLSELLKRLAVAECMQWRLRRQPLGVEDWRKIAGEDTGSMFEVAACLGDRSGRLRKFGGLLGLLYHGCDDVADVRGTTALGGGGKEDLRDGILTLPAALAVRDPKTAALFRAPVNGNAKLFQARLAEALPEAERYLDRLAINAIAEARRRAADPRGLITLVRQTRTLSAG
jgi:geranylgeranyl pyrophosphate synthase